MEHGGVPDPVVEKRQRIVQRVFDVEDDQVELDDFTRHGRNVVEEPLGGAALIADLHAGTLKVGDASGTNVAALGRTHVKEAVVDADRVEQIVDGDVSIRRKRLLVWIQRIRHPGARVETDEEVVELGALVVPVFGREKPERIRERLGVCRGTNTQTQVHRIASARAGFAGTSATLGVRKFVAVGEQIRNGRLRSRADVRRRPDIPRIVLITHDARGHTGQRRALERDDVDAERRHDRRLFVPDVRQLRGRWRHAVREKLIGGDDAPALLGQWWVFRGDLAELHGLGHVHAGHAGKLHGRAAQVRRVIERHRVAVVVDIVANDLERARIDVARAVAAGAKRVAAVAAAGGPAIAVEVHVVVNNAVAVVIEVVAACFVARKHLTHACAPAAAIGVARLRAAFANTDVVCPGRTLVTRLLLPRHALARSVLQNVPLATVLRVLVTVGKTRLASAERADAVLTKRVTVWRERTRILTEATVVFVCRKVVTTARAAREASLARLKTRATGDAGIGQTDRAGVAIGVDQTSDALETEFVAGLSGVAVVDARATDFAHV